MTHLQKLLSTTFFALLFVLFTPLAIEHGFAEFVREGETNSRIAWFLILLAFAYSHRNLLIHRIMLLIFLISGGMDIAYATTFGGVFTTASFEALALTDPHEAGEFLQAYGKLTNILIITSYVLLSCFFIWKTRVYRAQTRTQKTFVTLGFILLAIVGYRIVIMQKFHDTIPGFMGTAASYFRGTGDVQAEITARKLMVTAYQQPINASDTDTAQTYIVLIGESLTRNHMGLYGYSRDTTPELNKLQNELLKFDNTISSHAQTQPSLRNALTQSSTQNKIALQDALSLVDLANKAGFKTWWISNQQPLRATLSAIASSAQETQFISNDFHGVENRRYDSFMLPYVEKALADTSAHKVIFIHMMGSHLQYANRYPEDFAQFSDYNVSSFITPPTDRIVNYINQYDNSVRYTDYFVGQVLNKLKQQQGINAALFFSDHGEEVYQSMDFLGHGPDNPSHNMFEIPLLVWTSPAYQQTRATTYQTMQQHVSAPFMLDDLYQFAGSIMGIHSATLIPELSPADPAYTAKPRIVYNRNYDEVFKQR
ncbi:MAG: sulfatase-like hydrolase/transferase [Oceanospirillaceae bacterium]|nr:sulfatase-like hydrolase/transferase [Oceanospirillaceae bacterium]MCP5334109.1 sulfatase-like hydrolase/transferase [Oceanospirillaceae bacterium]MCP5351255.1 sulfatase-like hydrolase/transferase [Oceanospirillaceae bacterium]